MDRGWSFKDQSRAQRILKRAVVRPHQAVESGFVEYLIPLRSREQLTLTGRLQVRVVRGAVTIWGARLCPSESFHWVTTPTWNAAPTLVASSNGKAKPTLKTQVYAWREATDVLELLEGRAWPVVVCLKLPRPTAASSPNLPLTSQRQTLEEKAHRKALLEACLPEEDSRRYRVHPAWGSLADRFGEMAPSLSSAAECSQRKPHVMMILGDPNVGKSSCCRFFLNALLSQHGEVYLLDTDLGQPEFTTPGLVSLHRISGPLLNFSTTAADVVINEQQKFCSSTSAASSGSSSSSSSSGAFQKSPSSSSSSTARVERIASFFVGSSSPSVDPLLYARSVRAAMDEYVALCDADPAAAKPLVVNTHGWMYGLGLQLIHAALRTCQPQLILRIGVHSALPRKNDKAPDSEGARSEASTATSTSMMLKSKRSILARTGPLSMDLSGDCQRSREELPTVIVDLECLIPSKVANIKRREKGKLNPATTRWLRFTTYFKPEFDSLRIPTVEPMQRFFESMPKTRLPLESLQFGTLHSEIGASGVISTFTGNVGFLCALRDCSSPPSWKYKEDSSAQQPAEAHGDLNSLSVVKVGPETVARCYSVVFVHSFDLANGDLICYTPTPIELLEQADTLLGGDMPWAPHSFQNQAIAGHEGTAAGGVSPLHPYASSWTLEGLSSGSRAPTLRPNFRRKLVKPMAEGKHSMVPPAKAAKAK
mmetsp:Transcript_23310/g.51222  ORF Transcript_23310/g.51222 Transcript_23310/m.51222 type:complete len:708 (+) Transcript_23310:65-2188(+)